MMIVPFDEKLNAHMVFIPSDNSGEFIALSPTGKSPSELSETSLKLVELLADTHRINTDEDLQRFEEKLTSMFPLNG